MEDCYKAENQEATKKSKSFEEQIEKKKQGIEKLQDLLVNESITDSEYKEIKNRYNHDLNDLIMSHTEISMGTKVSIEKLRFGISLLKELPYYYSHASLEAKRSIIGSIFPEKLEFENGKYRTARINEVVELLQLKVNDLETLQKRKVNISADKSNMAPPSGLEPETL